MDHYGTDLEKFKEVDGRALLGLDFETYSDVDLRVHGLDRYFESKNFRALIAHAVTKREGLQARFKFTLIGEDGEHDLEQVQALGDLIEGQEIVGHNVQFEQNVLAKLGLKTRPFKYIDSATAARMAGASGSLARAAPQLLGMEKLEMGEHLIKVFSIPGPYQEKNGSDAFDPQIIKDRPEDWEDFHTYCAMDADLGLTLVSDFPLPATEQAYCSVTWAMNDRGWAVDLDAVDRMQEVFESNKEQALRYFHQTVMSDKGEINFNSPRQLVKFCRERGINAKSFDEQHVDMMLKKVLLKLNSMSSRDPKRESYEEVYELLATKKILGGSALSKLQKIKDLVGADGQLRNNYIHYGAIQTGRTTGVGVQMQNLKQLRNQADIQTVLDWSNDKLAENLRQVFTSRDPEGQLIVGDFAAIEARGLAYLAGEEHVLEAYRNGMDLYKVSAAEHFGISYESVSKQERQFGKVGVLSCGYGAGWQAVQDFAAKMGVIMTDIEAKVLVNNWRDNRPATTNMWDSLTDKLVAALETKKSQSLQLGSEEYPVKILISVETTLESIAALKHNAMDLHVKVVVPNLAFERVFRGCYLQNGAVHYHKPDGAKTKELWTDRFTDKNGKRQYHKLWGGKLTGILVQSFCRELFMFAVARLETQLNSFRNVQIIGQFHDEIVADWVPPRPEGSWGSNMTLAQAAYALKQTMEEEFVPGMPVEAEVNFDYRYIK